ncbi:hypothetical protein ACP4OV_025782 [Aristida adscensionis]
MSHPPSPAAGRRMSQHGSQPLPLAIAPELDLDDDGRICRTGNLRTSAVHIVALEIGIGVLALAWSLAQLGWVGGLAMMAGFAFVMYFSAFMMIHCYRPPDGSDKRQRNSTYMDAVRTHLGIKRTWFCGFFQYLNLYGSAVAYCITAATCVNTIYKANCYHAHGHDAPCGGSHADHLSMLLFGVAQLGLCLIPNFHSMAWLCLVAAGVSAVYTSIGIGLGLAKIIGNGAIKGSITGVAMSTPTAKLWRVAQAIGDIAFAFPYTMNVLEIQDTLKSPPPEGETMQKANAIAVLVTSCIYFSISCCGYAAFGDATPGNVLTGFGFYEPFWLVDLANACIVIHLLGGYQLFSQQVFFFADRWCATNFPNSAFVNKFYTVRAPCLPAVSYGLNLQRLCFRAAYVASTTALAILFPYFNEVLGVLGAVGFWPLAVYLPVEMYCVQRRIRPWTRRWLALQAFSAACFVVGTFALVGSVVGVVLKRLG